MRKVIEEKAKTLTYDQLCHDIVLGSVAKAGIGSDIFNLAKKINPLRHVGVRKSKLLSLPEGAIGTGVILTQKAETA
jgi:ribosomal protein S3AE